jgi:hypothetical protein
VEDASVYKQESTNDYGNFRLRSLLSTLYKRFQLHCLSAYHGCQPPGLALFGTEGLPAWCPWDLKTYRASGVGHLGGKAEEEESDRLPGLIWPKPLAPSLMTSSINY